MLVKKKRNDKEKKKKRSCKHVLQADPMISRRNPKKTQEKQKLR
jgi:hypothetical protein